MIFHWEKFYHIPIIHPENLCETGNFRARNRHGTCLDLGPALRLEAILATRASFVME
jgi:hypothetical protein